MKSKITILLLAFTVFSISSCQKGKKSEDETEVPKIEVTTDKKRISPEMPSISANFEINEYFETFIAKNKNSTSIVNIEKPRINEKLLRKGENVKLEVNGYWVSDANKNQVTLEIYPNSFKLKRDNRPIIEHKLKLTRENKFLLFGYLKMVDLEDGLYYFFLKDGDTPIYTGKFMVNG